jgi:NAD-dependent DNA ligase
VTGRELQSAGQPMPPEPSGDQWDESEAAMRAPLLALQAGYPLDGARIVVTGKLQGYTRAAITELLEELGATVDMAVTRHTTLLIVGEAPGAKLARARALGVKAIAETDFQRLRSAVRPP